MPRGLRLTAALAACAVYGSCPPARADETEHDYQTWTSLSAHGPLVRGLWLWTDVHARFYRSFEPSAMIVRPGLSWRAVESLYLTAGYGWTPSVTRGEPPRSWGDLTFVDEHRVWEQIMWTPRDAGTGAAALFRGRLEQRFRPSSDGDTGVRLRAMWRGQVPVDAARTIFVIGWNEIFVGLNETTWGQSRGVDQNRFFFGLGWQAIATTLRLELGYTNVWLIRAGADPMNHVLGVNLFLGWKPPKRSPE